MFNYIKRDLLGYPYNGKYPPDLSNTTGENHGYRTYNEESFFYEFAVQSYELSFRYNGKYYYIEPSSDGSFVTGKDFHERYQRFEDPNDLLEHFLIDGVPLIRLINEVDDIEFY